MDDHTDVIHILGHSPTTPLFDMRFILSYVRDSTLFARLLIFGLYLQGICFAFYASVVIPSVPLVVKPHLIGTAFGLTGVF